MGRREEKGCIQAKFKDASATGTSKDDGYFKIPTAAFDKSAVAIAQMMNEIRAQGTGAWTAEPLKIVREADPAEAGADRRMQRALARRRWGVWFLAGGLPLLVVDLVLEKHTSLALQQALALSTIIFAIIFAFYMTRDDQRSD